jgi:ADP-heptose:LPS heptosyltransferase
MIIENNYTNAKKRISAIVDEVIDFYSDTGSINIHGLKLLWEMATHENSNIAKAGLEGLFPMFVERLSDSFSASSADHYYRAFAEIITFSRIHPHGKQMDNVLSQRGLKSKESLILRRIKLTSNSRNKFDGSIHKLKYIFVLSRFSVGAEIAINGVIINSLIKNCPHAEIFLVGAKKNHVLFEDIPKVKVLICDYPKNGGLFGRFNAWLNLLAIIDEKVSNLNPKGYLVIDPDSRLTQLGLLPVLRDETQYLFFDSRSFHEPNSSKIGELTGAWLHKELGISTELSKIYPPAKAKMYSTYIRENLVEESPVTAVSFGVGENNSKRYNFEFECNLILELLAKFPGSVWLLSGTQPSELKQKNNLFEAVTSKAKLEGINISGNVVDLIPKNKNTRFIAWDGPLAEYCCLIGAADYHIGYDSSGQHISAALEIPTVDIFVDPSNTESFVKRWSPTSSAKVEVIRLTKEENIRFAIQPVVEAWIRLS